MTENIKCCPFCGADEVLICRTNPNACWIECADCGATAASSSTREGAIDNWNDRVEKVDTYAKVIEDDDKGF
jgi:Lar family restriction alleviation protein